MHIHRIFLLLGVALTSPDGGGRPVGQEIAVELSSFEFAPSTITMVHGQDYVLRFRNVSGAGHDFAAPEFFTAARIAPEDARAIEEGRVEVRGDQEVSIRLVAPRPGTYRVRCTHFLHSTFGMKGRIVVT